MLSIRKLRLMIYLVMRSHEKGDEDSLYETDGVF